MKVRKLYIALGLIGLVLLLTNPSQNDFISFIHAKDIEYNKEGTGRTYNCLLFSIYSVNYEVYKKIMFINHENQKNKNDSISAKSREEEYKQEKQNLHNQALKNGRNRNYYSYDKLYQKVAANKPGLTKEKFAQDMLNSQNANVLYDNIKKVDPSSVPSSFGDFVSFYGFNIPLPEKKLAAISVPDDTIYNTITIDTARRFIGILKNFL